MNAQDRKFTIRKLHCSTPITIAQEESKGVDTINCTFPRQAGDRLTVSYVKYYTANGGIIFSLFNDPKDEDAQKLLQRLYPNCKVVGV